MTGHPGAPSTLAAADFMAGTCDRRAPSLRPVDNQHTVSCFLYELIPQEPLLRVAGLRKLFSDPEGLLKRTVGYVRAVDGSTFISIEGETLGLSGRAAAGRRPPHAVFCGHRADRGRGFMRLAGGSVVEMGGLRPPELRALRREMQISSRIRSPRSIPA